MKKFLAVICAAGFLFSSCGSDKSVENSNKQITSPPQVVKSEEKTFYSNGQFKVGTDIPADEYLAIGTGYVEVAKDSSGDFSNILVNDNIENAQRYLETHNGEYVKVTGDIKLYPSANAPKLDTSKKIPSGQFKVGADIPAGEYKISLESSGYFAVTKDTRRAYVKNQFTNEGGSFYVTVADGQYLQIKKGTGEFVGTVEQISPPVQQAAPVEEKSSPQWEGLPETFSTTPSIGATRAEFEKYHRKNASHASFDNYDNDEYLVTYSKFNGRDERIFVLTIQGVAGKTYDLNQFIPSDCETLEITEDYKDNMMISRVFKGHSAELEKIFPEYGGEFAYGFVLDAKTNSFISATFTAFP